MSGSNLGEFGFGDIFRQLQDDYAALRTGAQSVTSLAEVTGTFTDRKGLMTVVASATGEVSALTFKSSKYREMAPAELSHAILDAISKAKARAIKQTERVLPDTMPNGVSAKDLLEGKIDFSELLPVNLPSVLDVMNGHSQSDHKEEGGF
jgi:DNA-binding protein YbaB